MISIKNQYLSADINLKGAEICSLIKADTQLEYIWQADPAHWGRHAPILFPIVGKLRNNEYDYNGRHYAMNQHGFARDLDFEIIKQAEDNATFRLKSGPKTLLSYPFHFELIVKYELIQNKVLITYQVINNESNTLFFSIGAHPAFNCPLDPSHQRSEYSFEFSSQEIANSQLLIDGLRTGESMPILQSNTRIAIEDDLFENDALIFEGLASSAVSLVRGNEKVLTVHFDDWPYLGLWSKSAEAPFVCIEPWYGIADSTKRHGDIANKEGIRSLAPEGQFDCQYTVELH